MWVDGHWGKATEPAVSNTEDSASILDRLIESGARVSKPYAIKPNMFYKYGGGEDYHDLVAKPNNPIRTTAEFMNAISKASSGTLIYIDDAANIDLSNLPNNEPIYIPGGVTIASGRGRNGSQGARIFCTNKKQGVLFKINKNNIRVTGVRLEGPSTRKGGDYNNTSHAISVFGESNAVEQFNSVLIDNCEIFGWQGGGIYVYKSREVKIRYNYIHHNRFEAYYWDGWWPDHSGHGYGVEIADYGNAIIEYNLFFQNRHDIACSGHPKSSYIARSNLVLGSVMSHRFDVHGYREKDCDTTRSDGNAVAGDFFIFENNILVHKDHASIKIRGVPNQYVRINNNQFSRGRYESLEQQKCCTPILKNISSFILEDMEGISAVGNQYGKSYPAGLFISYAGTSIWRFRNFSSAALAQMAVGDFNGDDKDDLFYTSNGRWYLSNNATSNWQEINTSDAQWYDLRFGDFDGDGKTDVFRRNNGKWQVSLGGRGQWINWNESEAALSALRFGDFDGDGKTDVFRSVGNKWKISKGGKSQWIEWNTSDASLEELSFGDFNGDGKTDVLRTHKNQWLVSWSGQSLWKVINTSSIGAGNLSIADFNGDGKADIFDARDNKWYVSWSGQSLWQEINRSDVDSFIFGDFDGDKKTDLLRSYKDW